MKKRFISIVLVLCLIIGFSPIGTCAAPNGKISTPAIRVNSLNVSTRKSFSTLFAGGTGTADNPYRVETAEQLNAIRYNLSACYIQVADIDISEYEWKPIGDPQYKFRPYLGAFTDIVGFEGTFNGNGFTINGLTIHSASYFQIGLFAACEKSSKIENLRLTNVDIDADYSEHNFETLWEENHCTTEVCAGGIASGSEGEIYGCEVSGKIHIRHCANACVAHRQQPRPLRAGGL